MPYIANMTSKGFMSAGTDKDSDEVISISSIESCHDDGAGIEQGIEMIDLDSDDDGYDMVSTEGNVGDDCRELEEDDFVPTSYRTYSSTARSNQRMISMSVPSSPRRLTDCSCRCHCNCQEDHEQQISSMARSYNEIIKEMLEHHKAERLRIVQQTKKKQWCSNCWTEARRYCCWQTSYCSALCQLQHWYV